MNIGIVGCGNISETYFECQNIFNNFKIVACADINKEAASNAASKYNVNALSVDEILENKELEKVAREIGKSLRCLVCQNEDIENSNADIAKDLRLLVRKKLS